MIPIIGLSGVARSGKTHVAKLLFANYNILPWASANHIKLSAYAQKHCKWTLHDFFYGEKPSELRQYLQQLGTEMGRDVYGNQYWIKQVEGFVFIAEHEFGALGVSVGDIRFPDEADFVRSLGGIVLKIERDGAGLSGGLETHRSEVLVSQTEFDGVIDNSGFPEDKYLLDQLAPYLHKLGVD
jgi:hypothetical protein